MKKIMKFTLGLLLLMLPVTGCSASPQTSAGSSGPVTLRVGTWNIAAKNHPDTQAMAELFGRRRHSGSRRAQRPQSGGYGPELCE